MSSVLEIRDLTLRIGDAKILRGLNLSIAPGETKGLVGRSGSGKSMCALAAMGLPPSNAILGGAVFLEKENLMKKSEREMCAIRGRDISMIFQEPMTALNPLHTIGAQVAEPLRIHQNISKDLALKEAMALLKRVGLPSDPVSLDKYPHQLSGGQRQRVMIAMAIALKPKVLIADEPTTALDVLSQAKILTLLHKLSAEDEIALLLITHNLEAIADIADQIAIMKAGEIVDHGETRSFLKSGRDPSTETSSPTMKTSLNGAPSQSIDKFVLRAEGLVCDYALKKTGMFSKENFTRAVDDVSVSIRKGEKVALVGESGCGKSTLARTLLGLQPSNAGSIELDGKVFPSQDKTLMRRLRQKIQIVFQDPYSSFNPRHKVEQILAEPFHLFDPPIEANWKQKKISTALKKVGLNPSDKEKYPNQFSGGQRQRIALARALMTEPEIIVLDEATSALDIISRNRILNLLRKLSDDQQMGCFIITHDLSVVRNITDRVLVMKAGRIVEEGSTREIFQSPKTDYAKMLVEATPKINLSIDALS